MRVCVCVALCILLCMLNTPFWTEPILLVHKEVISLQKGGEPAVDHAFKDPCNGRGMLMGRKSVTEPLPATFNNGVTNACLSCAGQPLVPRKLVYVRKRT